ncbi:MAG: alpha/beta hydrolase [Lacisediminihabitans sp.]
MRASAHPVESYAPRELVVDPAQLGLITTTVVSALGSCVAHHNPERTSVRATIFLHGAAGSWTSWTPLLHTAAAHGHPIANPVLLDLPGWGEASLTEARGDEAIATLCELVKDLAEELGYTEWDLIGHSLGGFVALHMASLWPHRVLSVGMVSGTTFSVINSVTHPFRCFTELPAFTMLWRVMQVLSLGGRAGAAFVRATDFIGILGLLTFPLFRHWTRIPSSQRRALALEVRPRTFSVAALAVHGYDAAKHWARIDCPVRATKGDRDVFVTPEDFLALARVLSRATFTVVPDCGHFGNIERPHEVLIALGFLGSTVES